MEKRLRRREESEVWEIVNMERRKTRRINEGIKREEWEEYFRRLLGGVEEKEIRGEKKEKRGDNRRELSRREIKEAIGKLKDERKGSGVDEISREVWRYGGEETERWMEERKIWGEEGWPEDWKEGVIVPVRKKRKGKEVKEYRGNIDAHSV